MVLMPTSRIRGASDVPSSGANLRGLKRFSSILGFDLRRGQHA